MGHTMTSQRLADLARSGVLEYGRSRAGVTLRASPRFLDHAEATAQRLGTHGSLGTRAVLQAALASWDDDGRGLANAAGILADFLGERDQLGALRPVFPVLEQYAIA